MRTSALYATLAVLLATSSLASAQQSKPPVEGGAAAAPVEVSLEPGLIATAYPSVPGHSSAMPETRDGFAFRMPVNSAFSMSDINAGTPNPDAAHRLDVRLDGYAGVKRTGNHEIRIKPLAGGTNSIVGYASCQTWAEVNEVQVLDGFIAAGKGEASKIGPFHVQDASEPLPVAAWISCTGQKGYDAEFFEAIMRDPKALGFAIEVREAGGQWGSVPLYRESSLAGGPKGTGGYDKPKPVQQQVKHADLTGGALVQTYALDEARPLDERDTPVATVAAAEGQIPVTPQRAKAIAAGGKAVAFRGETYLASDQTGAYAFAIYAPRVTSGSATSCAAIQVELDGDPIARFEERELDTPWYKDKTAVRLATRSLAEGDYLLTARGVCDGYNDRTVPTTLRVYVRRPDGTTLEAPVGLFLRRLAEGEKPTKGAGSKPKYVIKQ